MPDFQSDDAITVDSDAKLLRGTPMSTSPHRYPRVRFETLSDDARIMFLGAERQKLDRDVFAPRSRASYVSREDAAAFTPTDRMLAAIAELEHAGYARYEPDYKSLYRTEVHREYTVAYGRGSQLIEVSTLGDHDALDGRLIAVLIGADIEGRETRSRTLPEITVRARHSTGTDVEHDASTTASFTIANPSTPEFHGYGQMSFMGVLTEARLYPLGTDPAEVPDDSDRARGMCTRCEKPHPFVPYQPPLVDGLAGRPFVRVKAVPFRPYLVGNLSTPAPSYLERGEEDDDD